MTCFPFCLYKYARLGIRSDRDDIQHPRQWRGNGQIWQKRGKETSDETTHQGMQVHHNCTINLISVVVLL